MLSADVDVEMVFVWCLLSWNVQLGADDQVQTHKKRKIETPFLYHSKKVSPLSSTVELEKPIQISSMVYKKVREVSPSKWTNFFAV